MNTEWIKPQLLQPGDKVAVVSPSWGGPSLYPQAYEVGVRHLRDLLNVEVVEFPTTRAEADYLYHNPQKRAEDINAAFADPQIKAVFASIGGDDSVRILPFLDRELIRRNPKILMGFSDTTTLLTHLAQHGLVTFHGPSIMAGFASVGGMPAFAAHIRRMLTHSADTYTYQPFTEWVVEHQDWGATGYSGEVTLTPNDTGWQWLQGTATVQGRLFGGNLEVLAYFLNGTRYWPTSEEWQGKILFLETSEDKPSVDIVTWLLRNFGTQGIFERISGLLFGRAYLYTDAEKARLQEQIVTIVAGEFGCATLPIIANMDFGHTDPQFILPLGATAEIDCSQRTFRLLESPFAPLTP